MVEGLCQFVWLRMGRIRRRRGRGGRRSRWLLGLAFSRSYVCIAGIQEKLSLWKFEERIEEWDIYHLFLSSSHLTAPDIANTR